MATLVVDTRVGLNKENIFRLATFLLISGNAFVRKGFYNIPIGLL